MATKLGSLIDNTLANGGEISKIEYEICNEFIVPTLKNILRKSVYAISDELTKHLNPKSDDGPYTPVHFGWISNRATQDAVFPAHLCAIIRIAEKYYYVPVSMVNNIEKTLIAGSTKSIEKFEESNWFPVHIELSVENKEVFPEPADSTQTTGRYLIFRGDCSSKLKNSCGSILPGVGLNKFIYDNELISAKNINILKVKDVDIYTYFLEDKETKVVIDLASVSVSDVTDNIIIDDGEVYKLEFDLTLIPSKLYRFAEYLHGREIKIPSVSKRDLNVLIKAIQDGNITVSQLDKFETITGIGYNVIAHEQLENSVFVKFPDTERFVNVFQRAGGGTTPMIVLRRGVYVSSSTRVIQIMSRILNNTYTKEDCDYIYDNKIN